MEGHGHVGVGQATNRRVEMVEGEIGDASGERYVVVVALGARQLGLIVDVLPLGRKLIDGCILALFAAGSSSSSNLTKTFCRT